MNEIYFRQLPAIGAVITLETWEFPRKKDMVKTPLAEATVTAMDSVEEQVWNPVLKQQESVVAHYVTLSWNGNYYKRRAVLGGITSFSPRGYYYQTGSVPASSSCESTDSPPPTAAP